MTQTPVRFGVVVFPGSNCDHDAYYVCRKILGQDAVFLWHKTADLRGVDVVILPGGFSYGDYLRCGAIARKPENGFGHCVGDCAPKRPAAER